MKLIKTNKKYQQVTLNIEGEEESSISNVENSILFTSDISVNNITNINTVNEIDLTKLSKIQLLEKCQELGITKCKSKPKDKLKIEYVPH